jgi:hypothetical protein
MLRPGRANVNLPTTYAGGGSSVGYGGGDAGPGYGGYNGGGHLGGGASTSSNGNGGGSFREKSRSPRSRHASFAFDSSILSKLRNPGLYGYVLAFFFLVGMLSYRSGQNQLMASLESKTFKSALAVIQATKRQKEALQNQLNTARETQKVSKKSVEAEGNHRKLQKEIDNLKLQHEGPDRASEQLKIKTREEAWKSQVTLLQQATSRESRRAATAKYVFFCVVFYRRR